METLRGSVEHLGAPVPGREFAQGLNSLQGELERRLRGRIVRASCLVGHQPEVRYLQSSRYYEVTLPVMLEPRMTWIRMVLHPELRNWLATYNRLVDPRTMHQSLFDRSRLSSVTMNLDEMRFADSIDGAWRWHEAPVILVDGERIWGFQISSDNVTFGVEAARDGEFWRGLAPYSRIDMAFRIDEVSISLLSAAGDVYPELQSGTPLFFTLHVTPIEVLSTGGDRTYPLERLLDSDMTRLLADLPRLTAGTMTSPEAWKRYSGQPAPDYRHDMIRALEEGKTVWPPPGRLEDGTPYRAAAIVGEEVLNLTNDERRLLLFLAEKMCERVAATDELFRRCAVRARRVLGSEAVPLAHERGALGEPRLYELWQRISAAVAPLQMDVGPGAGDGNYVTVLSECSQVDTRLHEGISWLALYRAGWLATRLSSLDPFQPMGLRIVSVPGAQSELWDLEEVLGNLRSSPTIRRSDLAQVEVGRIAVLKLEAILLPLEQQIDEFFSLALAHGFADVYSLTRRELERFGIRYPLDGPEVPANVRRGVGGPGLGRTEAPRADAAESELNRLLREWEQGQGGQILQILRSSADGNPDGSKAVPGELLPDFGPSSADWEDPHGTGALGGTNTGLYEHARRVYAETRRRTGDWTLAESEAARVFQDAGYEPPYMPDPAGFTVGRDSGLGRSWFEAGRAQLVLDWDGLPSDFVIHDRKLFDNYLPRPWEIADDLYENTAFKGLTSRNALRSILSGKLLYLPAIVAQYHHLLNGESRLVDDLLRTAEDDATRELVRVIFRGPREQ